MSLSSNVGREGVTASGVFLSVPDAFPDSMPHDIRSMIKLLFELEPRYVKDDPKAVNPAVKYATDVVMVDLGALNPDSFESERAIRDCEILIEILKRDGAKVPNLVAALQQGSDAGIDKADRIVKSMGLTEEEFIKQGGGVGVLIIVVLAVMTLTSCATTKNAERGRASGSTTTPKPP